MSLLQTFDKVAQRAFSRDRKLAEMEDALAVVRLLQQQTPQVITVEYQTFTAQLRAAITSCVAGEIELPAQQELLEIAFIKKPANAERLRDMLDCYSHALFSQRSLNLFRPKTTGFIIDTDGNLGASVPVEVNISMVPVRGCLGQFTDQTNFTYPLKRRLQYVAESLEEDIATLKAKPPGRLATWLQHHGAAPGL